MAWDTVSAFLTRGLSPLVSTIIITAIIALSLPLFVHYYLYRQAKSATLPTFLLAGPSGAGKTSLVTLFERGTPSQTHLSQTPLSVTVTLPSSTPTSSNKYRSQNDAASQSPTRLQLLDTPGHGKLRHHALTHLQPTDKLKSPLDLRGIIFLVDATSLSSNSSGPSGTGNEPARADEGLTEAAEYLHDILLLLQKRHTSSKSSRGPKAIPVLIAANKMDLFTALPAPLVKNALEAEITKVRATRAKGLLDVGTDVDQGAEEEREWLGEGGEGKFEFRQMEEVDVVVEVRGGNVLGSGGEEADVKGWWEWIGSQL